MSALGSSRAGFDEALGALRAIPPPPRDRDMLDWLLDFLEPPIDVLRGVPAAVAGGEPEAVEALLQEHVRRTGEKDWRVSFYSGGWHSLASSLRSCPVAFGT